MRIQFLQDIIDKIRNKNNRLSFNHRIYGKCYYPFYDKNMTFSFKKPHIYNAQGRLMDIFFLKSSSTWYDPYSSSKYFMWDRYNFGLESIFMARM